MAVPPGTAFFVFWRPTQCVNDVTLSGNCVRVSVTGVRTFAIEKPNI